MYQPLSCMLTLYILLRSSSHRTATSKQPIEVEIDVNNSLCHSIGYLEHVEVITSITIVSGKRGAVSLSLQSPMGTKSNLLHPRYLDNAKNNIKQWPFMTIQSWGESPSGKWVVKLNVQSTTTARFDELTLVLYGVPSTPLSVSAIPSQCHKECARGCAKPGAQYCDTCKHARLASTLECVPACPAGTYLDFSMCRPCPTNCSECTSTRCLSCHHDNVLLPGGTCSYHCPVSSYKIANKTCLPCHQSCQSCVGPGYTNCSACASSQYKLMNGMCELVTTCDPHLYYDHRAFECRSCHTSCAECRGKESVDCTACYPDWIQVDGHCVQNPRLRKDCPDDKYYNEELSNCSSCPNGCSSCSDDITCTHCQPGYFLQTRSVGETTEETVLCHTSCTGGFYKNSTLLQCLPCPTSCVSCDSPSSCLSCVIGSPLNGTCSQPCGPREYYNLSLRRCLPCSPLCSSCLDGTKCTGCTGQLLLTPSGRCVSTCPNHTVADQTSLRCKLIRCHPSCSTCHGSEPNQCLSCLPPRKLHQNMCLEQCPHHTYPAKHSCSPCHHTCATCGGPLDSDCDSCPSGSYFDHYHCIKSCPLGSFSSNDGRCLSCLPNCTECSDVRSCKQCFSGLVYSQAEQSCVPNCPSGLYNNSGVCQLCAAACTACKSKSHCTKCLSGHVLLLGTCLQCCSRDITRGCCDCSSSMPECVFIKRSSSNTPSPIPVSSSPSSQPIVAIMVTVIVISLLLATVSVAGVLVYRQIQHKSSTHYTALEQAHDGLSISVDNEFDSESENELYSRQRS